jgi:hypothetical protein
MTDIQAMPLPVLTLEGPLTIKNLRASKPVGIVEHVVISGCRLLHKKLAEEIATWDGVKQITISLSTTRAALRVLLNIPTLEQLDAGFIHKHGSFENVEMSDTLGVLTCMGLGKAELLEISKLPNLTNLNIRHASLSVKVVEAIAAMPKLVMIDLENSALNDEMVTALSKSSSLSELWIGGTKISRKGLKRICGMRQLRELDIWALNINESDLEMLKSLHNLSYLVVGGYDGQTRMTAKGVLPRLEKIPNLTSIWLDGIKCTDAEISKLKLKYDYVQVTFCEDC